MLQQRNKSLFPHLTCTKLIIGFPPSQNLTGSANSLDPISFCPTHPSHGFLRPAPGPGPSGPALSTRPGPDPDPTRTRPGPSLGPYGPRPTVGLTRPHRPAPPRDLRHEEGSLGPCGPRHTVGLTRPRRSAPPRDLRHEEGSPVGAGAHHFTKVTPRRAPRTAHDPHPHAD